MATGDAPSWLLGNCPPRLNLFLIADRIRNTGPLILVL